MIAALLASLALAPQFPSQPSAPTTSDKVDVWTSGEGGYHTYRIPAVLRAPDGALLAFCEGRKGGRGDSGDIDLLMKRSADGGATSSSRCRGAKEGRRASSPCPEYEQKVSSAV